MAVLFLKLHKERSHPFVRRVSIAFCVVLLYSCTHIDSKVNNFLFLHSSSWYHISHAVNEKSIIECHLNKIHVRKKAKDKECTFKPKLVSKQEDLLADKAGLEAVKVN